MCSKLDWILKKWDFFEIFLTLQMQFTPFAESTADKLL